MADSPEQVSPYAMSQASFVDRITYFALTDSRSRRIPFGIKRSDRERHTYVIGKTGMGKSTLLENMAIQDIQNGEGLCFIDPHGGTAEKLLEYIPEERVKDVLYFAPFDLEYPISFNVLEEVEADKRHFVVAGLMSTFEKIWVDAWSARMAYILQNTLAGLLEFPGATLLGVNRMYVDKDYRKAVISKITDPAVRSFWVDEYSKYTDRYTQEATPAIQNKIGQFQSNALVRNIIGQPESAFDIRRLMDERKIFIVNLSKGRIGEGNARLLGSMLITKVYLAAMSRADASASSLRQLPNFFLYVDEFQNFANRSFADILSEARKYKLCLTIAHQYIEQMEEEVRAAVFGNVGTMMTFRVGAFDAEVLEKEFAPVFTADDLVNLGARQIYLKLMIDGVSSQPFSAVTMPPIEEPRVSHRDRAVAFSRSQFSRPRAEVERDIGEWMGHSYVDPEEEARERSKAEQRARARGADEHARMRPPERPGPAPVRNAPRPEREAPQYSRPRIGTPAPVSRDTRDGYAPRAPVAPERTEPPVREERRPEPVVSARVQVPPPPPPAARQGDLKSILAKVAAAQPRPIEPPTESRAHAPRLRDEQRVRTAPPRTSPPPTPLAPPVPRSAQPSPGASGAARDDGKGVSEDGRRALKDLLAKVTAAKPAQPDVRQATAGAGGSPGSQPRATPQAPVHAPPDERPAGTAKKQEPVDIPEERLRELLAVERPDATP